MTAHAEGTLPTIGTMVQVGGMLPGGLSVRGISGGERRRLSIGCGVVGAPRIIALDEPTSGMPSILRHSFLRHICREA